MSNVTFSGVSKHYGDTTALDRLDLSIAAGEFVALLGPSGSGKTTTPNLLAGLIDADAGAAGRQCIVSLAHQRLLLLQIPVMQDHAHRDHVDPRQRIDEEVTALAKTGSPSCLVSFCGLPVR